MIALATARAALEAMRDARAAIAVGARPQHPGTLARLDRAIALLAVDALAAAVPLGCDTAKVPIELTDKWGSGIAIYGDLVLDLDIRPTDNTPTALDGHVVVGYRLQLDPFYLTPERLAELAKTAERDSKAEPALEAA